ncbi:hypothetical protein MES5069_390075 [Mesorhizobium escarrei]|uniref:Uncharacterized protein n=1 Tax=Mesorhizobium escarrei TaxID=666018 RepID=A0ABM9E3D2_9HYPH|nr:hypothetical protein MES5069_390075 [Mesorhizobium escarrei]
MRLKSVSSRSAVVAQKLLLSETMARLGWHWILQPPPSSLLRRCAMTLVPQSSQRNAIDAALDRLGAEAAAAEHLLGHNIIRHDLPHLVPLRPGLANIFRSLRRRPL